MHGYTIIQFYVKFITDLLHYMVTLSTASSYTYKESHIATSSLHSYTFCFQEISPAKTQFTN